MIHIIDGLLTLPPNVSTVAQEAGLSAFLGAVNATGLTEAVTTTPDLTIFAPNNAAFQDISSALSNLTTEEAAAILQYHLPEDYYNTYTARALATTPAEIDALAKSIILPRQPVWIVVGDMSRIEAGVRALNLGEVRRIDADGKPLP